jgi:methionyl-tRNA formyltransferase
MDKVRVYISGQKYFGAEVYRICREMPGVEILGVCCPIGDLYIRKLAEADGVPCLPSGMLNASTMPDGVDLGIAAHSFDYVGRATRYKARIGWIGYHPSLLPRHRGRSSIEWAIRMRDFATGGSVFWLNSGIDRGDIICQEHLFIDPRLYAMDPKKAAKILWTDELLPMGSRLMKVAISDICAGKIIRIPQDPRFSTFEPSTDVSDIYKPDRLMLEPPKPH